MSDITAYRQRVFTCGKRTANGNIYSEEVLEKALTEYKKRIDTKTALGPVDDRGNIDLVASAFMVVDIELKNGKVSTEVKVLETEAGKRFADMLEQRRVKLVPMGKGEPGADGYVREYTLDGFSYEYIEPEIAKPAPSLAGKPEIPPKVGDYIRLLEKLKGAYANVRQCVVDMSWARRLMTKEEVAEAEKMIWSNPITPLFCAHDPRPFELIMSVETVEIDEVDGIPQANLLGHHYVKMDSLSEETKEAVRQDLAKA